MAKNSNRYRQNVKRLGVIRLEPLGKIRYFGNEPLNLDQTLHLQQLKAADDQLSIPNAGFHFDQVDDL